jgi:hypothetical protein
MPAPEKNQNAVKDEADVASSFLHVRVVPRDKAAWVKAAKRRKKKLAEWTTETLNHAALVPPNDRLAATRKPYEKEKPQDRQTRSRTETREAGSCPARC